MSTLKDIRELYQSNVDSCKKEHKLISRAVTTTTQMEVVGMSCWENEEETGLGAEVNTDQDNATGCKLRANLASFKALYLKLIASCISKMVILRQVKGLKEEISLAIEKKSLIEDLLGTIFTEG